MKGSCKNKSRHRTEWEGRAKVWYLQCRAADGAGTPADCLGASYARNWYEVVGSGDLCHFGRGTDFQVLDEAFEVRTYVKKPMKCVTKEEDAACKLSACFVGCRAWGVRAKLPFAKCVVVELKEALFFVLRRLGAAFVQSVSVRKRRLRPCRPYVRHPLQRCVSARRLARESPS
jgi:hypothetical protein